MARNSKYRDKAAGLHDTVIRHWHPGGGLSPDRQWVESASSPLGGSPEFIDPFNSNYNEII